MGDQTIEEVAREISEGLPEYQYQANLDWLINLHARLKPDGIWMSPVLGTVYQKTSDGFIKLLQGMDYMEVSDTPDLTGERK